jgi:hypothetical protein
MTRDLDLRRMLLFSISSRYLSAISWRLHEIVRRPRPEFWLSKNWLLDHDNAAS